VVEWVAAGINSKNVWTFCCLLAKITSLVNNVQSKYYQFNRVKGGSMKLKLASYMLNLSTTELKCQFVNWLLLLLAMVVIEKIIKRKNRYYRFIKLAYSGLMICL